LLQNSCRGDVDEASSSIDIEGFVEPQNAGAGIHGPEGFVTKPRKRKHRKTVTNPYTAAAFHFSDDDDFQL